MKAAHIHIVGTLTCVWYVGVPIQKNNASEAEGKGTKWNHWLEGRPSHTEQG